MDSANDYSVEEEAGTASEPNSAHSELGGLSGDDSPASQSDSGSASQLEDEGGLSEIDRRSNLSPLKRPAEQDSVYRPFKRQKGVVNADYLDLLNREIEDAAHRLCLQDNVNLPDSQLGLTAWSSVEKRQFFESLSRLGRYDLPGIAASIGTKSELEVKEYINLLQEAAESRISLTRRSFLEPAEYPAAVEISQQCCHAQEEAADAISARQEDREQQREKRKWGKHWDITPSLARRLSPRTDDAETMPESALKFAQLFHLSKWLRLSERAFMNSSIPGNNWNFVDDKPPSVWATAFDDFYSLAVSLTRRLVLTTLFISTSRIRAKRELIPTTQDVVRRKDVEAAIESLGLSHNSKEWWKKSATRLRLEVFDEPPDKNDEDGEQEPMTYGAVEDALSCGPDGMDTRPSDLDRERLDDSSDDAVQDVSQDENFDTGIDSEAEAKQEVDVEEYEITREVNEVLWYSAPDFRDLRSAKRALRRRVTIERQQEAQAQLHDEFASSQAEAEMWNILQKKPPLELPKPADPGRLLRSTRAVEDVYPLGRDWASKLDYYEEWETLDDKNHED